MRMLMLSLAAAGLMAGCAAPVDPGPSNPSDGAPTQCRADQYRYLIGRNRSEIPSTPVGQTWRVACTTCPVTMDYNPNRLNIFYDEATGVIRRVECG